MAEVLSYKSVCFETYQNTSEIGIAIAISEMQFSQNVSTVQRLMAVRWRFLYFKAKGEIFHPFRLLFFTIRPIGYT